jgi:hypothetical protein
MAAGFPARVGIGLRWPHFGLTAALNVAAYCASTSSILSGQRAYDPAGDTPETLYGSEGWRGPVLVDQTQTEHGAPRRSVQARWLDA